MVGWVYEPTFSLKKKCDSKLKKVHHHDYCFNVPHMMLAVIYDCAFYEVYQTKTCSSIGELDKVVKASRVMYTICYVCGRMVTLTLPGNNLWVGSARTTQPRTSPYGT